MTTQTQARQFFEDKIVQQAGAEGVPLSADERLMLKWSESEPDSIADPDLVDHDQSRGRATAYAVVEVSIGMTAGLRTCPAVIEAVQ